MLNKAKQDNKKHKRRRIQVAPRSYERRHELPREIPMQQQHAESYRTSAAASSPWLNKDI